MPINDAPTLFDYGGFRVSIRGKPFERETTIELLLQGNYEAVLRRHDPALRKVWAEATADRMWELSPVKTGRLKASIHASVIGRAPVVRMGPQKFNREREIAKMEGWEWKKRGKGRPRLTGFYGLPANERSRSPEYVERGLMHGINELLKAINDVLAAEEMAERAQLIVTGRRR